MRLTAMKLSSQVRALALIVVLGALVFGCGSDGADDVGSRPSVTSRDATYVVTGVTEKGAKRALVPGSEIRLTFAGDQLGITAGCNTMSGMFRLDGTRLTVEGLASTEMGCEQALMAQDAWVAGLFAEPVQLNVGNDAAIISGDVVLMLTDREIASPDLPLVGTRWDLDTLIDGDVASSVPAGADGFLRIEGTQVSLKDGCNSGAGTVEISGDMLVVDQLSRTKKLCRGTAEVEDAFAAVLDGAASYKIEENRLTITHDDRGLGFRSADAR